MGTRAPRAIFPTLLIAGLFFAPLTSLAQVNASASSSPIIIETSEVPSAEIVTINTASTTELLVPFQSEQPPTSRSIATALPTGVLFDNSASDEIWNVNVLDQGRYINFFGGYDTLGNPPLPSISGAWVTTGTTTVVRIKPAGSTTCEQLRYSSTAGISFSTPTYDQFFTDQRFTVRAGDMYCDFYFEGDGIPPGTRLSMAALGNYGTTTLAGSSHNRGNSLDASNSNPVPGGFAFQLCGTDGCSGGFQPTATTTATTTPLIQQVSNVLFLPGIKGSRLYSDENKCSALGCDNKLWDPGSNDDIRDLLLTPQGKSLRTDIYVKQGDIIDKIDKNYYFSFIQQMNELQASTTFNAGAFKWVPAAYDWRLSLDDIVNNGVERNGRIYYEEASSTPYIEQTLRQLAASSKTGKVTIIAHSNGGLVTKALLSKLGSVEAAALVDKIIFVGVPQTGAPQAIGGLLFGNREGLPSDSLPFIASPASARTLASHSPMAYHLLPTAQYLRDVQDPTHSIIGFSGTHLYTQEVSAYGNTVDTLEELDNFLLAREGGRTMPNENDVKSANILNADLIDYANHQHASLDTWAPPSGVTLYQIAGWGVDTISGVELYDEQKTFGFTTSYKRQYRPVFVEDGDGVVPVPSALMTSASDNVKRYWVDLNKKGKDHGNLLELNDLRTLLEKIINGESHFPDSILYSQPVSNRSEKKLIFTLHSPLTLGIYDEQNNYTGILADGQVHQDVSGAQYGEFGDVKYIIAAAGHTYRLAMQGHDQGEFSLDIQEQIGDDAPTTSTFANVPTTSSTTVSLTITNGISDASNLSVDENGDGVTDIELAPQANQTVAYIAPTIQEEIKVSHSHNTAVRGSVLGISTSTLSFPEIVTVMPIKTVDEKQKYNLPLRSTDSKNFPIVKKVELSYPTGPTPSYSMVNNLLYNIWNRFMNFLKGLFY